MFDKRDDDRFVAMLTDPTQRAKAIPAAKRARTVLQVVFLVVFIGVMTTLITMDADLGVGFALGAVLVAIGIYVDLMVKLLLAFEAADVAGGREGSARR